MQMIIYLIAITIFIIQCAIMYFIYFKDHKLFKSEMAAAYHINNNLDQFFYFLLVPCLNEEKVIQNTLQNLLNLAGQKEIIVIDDDSDDQTIQKIKKMSGPISTVERKLPNARTGKGDSLNNAMSLVHKIIKQRKLDPKKCIVGVIDADGILSANCIYKINNAFEDEHIDAVQLRVKMKKPTTVLQTFQDIEFYTINHLIQLIRGKMHAVALCGNGQFFRYKTVTQRMGIKPWGNALLEDFELTLKFELNGLNIKYLDDAYVDQEALLNFKTLIRQRSRWAQGGLDCWKYLFRVTKSPIMSKAQKFDTYFFLTQPLLNVLADFSIIYLTIKYLIYAVGNPSFFIVSLFFLVIIGSIFGMIFTLIYLHELRITQKANIAIEESDMLNLDMKLGKFLLTVGLLSYIYVVLFLSLMKSIYSKIRGNTHWVKTKRI